VLFRSSSLARGYRTLLHTPHIPQLVDLTAITFRIVAGCCHGQWWLDQKLRPDIVVYGHTGLGDTTKLEIAQQSTGSKTIHAVHGISEGWNYSAISTFGIFRCGHDKRLHAGLYGYDETKCVEQSRPNLDPGHNGWVIFSNYLHPTHSSYLRNGADDELRLLEIVASAATTLEYPTEKIVWKPHPAIFVTDQSCQEQAFSKARNLGFQLAGPDEDFSNVTMGKLILTSPSTIAIDALKIGKLPVIIAVLPFAKNTAIGSFPIIANDCKSLVAAIKQNSATRNHDMLYKETYKTIAPATALAPDYFDREFKRAIR